MKTQSKLKIKEFKDLNLRGIEIEECIESSSDDLKHIKLKDTISGVSFSLTMTNYNDFALYADKPPVMEDRFIVTGEQGPAKITASFRTKREAEDYVDSQGDGFKITEEKVQVE